MKFQLNPEFPDATPAQKWDQFRIWRETQLRLTDWTQLPDAPLSDQEVQKYMTYREFLRNAPQDYSNVEDINFESNVELRDYKVSMVEVIYKIDTTIKGN